MNREKFAELLRALDSPTPLLSDRSTKWLARERRNQLRDIAGSPGGVAYPHQTERLTEIETELAKRNNQVQDVLATEGQSHRETTMPIFRIHSRRNDEHVSLGTAALARKKASGIMQIVVYRGTDDVVYVTAETELATLDHALTPFAALQVVKGILLNLPDAVVANDIELIAVLNAKLAAPAAAAKEVIAESESPVRHTGP